MLTELLDFSILDELFKFFVGISSTRTEDGSSETIELSSVLQDKRLANKNTQTTSKIPFIQCIFLYRRWFVAEQLHAVKRGAFADAANACGVTEDFAERNFGLQKVGLAVATDFFHLTVAGLNVARHEASKIHGAFERQLHNGLVKLHVGGLN